jgi:uncharacterized protein involved in response to NO
MMVTPPRLRAASPARQVIYLLVIVAALARVAGAFTVSMAMLHLAAGAWVAAFGAFVVVYGPLLARRPPVWSAWS